MKKQLLSGIILLGILLCSAMAATAYDYGIIGDNVTIYDGKSDNGRWYHNQEDHEIEPGAQPGQRWDMEAFFWKSDSRTLTMIGGYDLMSGVHFSGYDRDVEANIDPGHIFLDVGNDGSWDYAIAFHSTSKSTSTATWYKLDNSSVLSNTAIFSESETWRFVSGETASGTLTSVYTDFFRDDLAGVATGASHNAIALDLSDLTLGTSFTAYFTMECGNDVLMGKISNVPIPGAVWLLGSGLAGLFCVRRRRK